MFDRKISEAEVKNLITYEITELKLELEKLKTHINSLRGLINRRNRQQLDDDEFEEETKKPKSKKDEMLVAI